MNGPLPQQAYFYQLVGERGLCPQEEDGRMQLALEREHYDPALN